MTTPSLAPEERQRINRTISEAQGWKFIAYNDQHGAPWVRVESPTGHQWSTIAQSETHAYKQLGGVDYCSSLDACALAEAVLSEEKHDRYTEALITELQAHRHDLRAMVWMVATAKPEQKARALATIFARRAQQ